MTVAQAHSELEELVGNRYREAGYEVILEPAAHMIPFDLGGFVPDLIARKSGVNLIVKVQTNTPATSYERLRGAVEETRRHEGWRFVLVTERDRTAALLPDDDDFSWEEVEEGIRKADALKFEGEIEAAYLLLWIAFERTIRKLSVEASLPLNRLSPPILIRQLYSEGELSMSQFDSALSCLEARNQLVHGFRTADLSGTYERLRAVLAEAVPN